MCRVRPAQLWVKAFIDVADKTTSLIQSLANLACPNLEVFCEPLRRLDATGVTLIGFKCKVALFAHLPFMNNNYKTISILFAYWWHVYYCNWETQEIRFFSHKNDLVKAFLILCSCISKMPSFERQRHRAPQRLLPTVRMKTQNAVQHTLLHVFYFIQCCISFTIHDISIFTNTYKENSVTTFE